MRTIDRKKFSWNKKSKKGGTKDPRPTKNCRVCYVCRTETEKEKPLKTLHIHQTSPSKTGFNITDCFEI